MCNAFVFKLSRKRLFGMMNDLPTVFEVVSGGVKQSKERDRSGTDNSGRNKLSAKVTRIHHCFYHLFYYHVMMWNLICLSSKQASHD